jgi:hypothetical protein
VHSKISKKWIIFAEKLNDFALARKTTQIRAIMRDIFLKRVGNNGEEQIQDSRTHSDILRNILCGAYTAA